MRAYRDGALSRESLLTEVERQLAERRVDAVALLKLLNEEHARLRLPDNLHSAIAARILHWRDPRPAAVLPDQPNVTRMPAHDGAETVIIEREAGSVVAQEDRDGFEEAEARRAGPVTLGGVLQGRLKLLAPADFQGMPAAQAERIIEGIAAALDFAHRNGPLICERRGA